MHRVRGLVVAAVAAGFLLVTGVAHAQGVSFANGDGITVDSQRLVNPSDPRLYQLMLTTTAIPATSQPADEEDLDILLPTNYNPATHYPVLYLYDGTEGLASNWTQDGDAEALTAGLPLIVVMPNIDIAGDGGGWCNNWTSSTGVTENWTTYHIDQLIPWVDANLPTIADRGGRAIAGLSQGGFCSISYAARFPDLFSVALAYSGAPDIWWDKPAYVGASAIIHFTEVYDDELPPDTFFGNELTDQLGWAAADPATLAENLANTKMYLYWGNGFPGCFPEVYTCDPDPSDYGEANLIEGAVYYSNEFFEERLDSLGIPAYFDYYGNGDHSWSYWTQDFQQSIGDIMSDLESPAPAPANVTYTSAANSYSVYGWNVTMDRSAQEFSTLSNADSCGFNLSGSGSATVVTPDDYTPGQTYTVSLSGPNASGTETAVANASGQLSLSVPLGTANSYQEYTVQAIAAGTNIYTTAVTVLGQTPACAAPAPPPPCAVPSPDDTGSQVALGSTGDECATDLSATPTGNAYTTSGQTLPTAPIGDTSTLPVGPALSGSGNATAQSGPAVSLAGNASAGDGLAIGGAGG